MLIVLEPTFLSKREGGIIMIIVPEPVFSYHCWQILICIDTKTVGATVLGGLWALEWAWQSAETNLRCVRCSGICTPNLNSLAPIVSEISAFIRTDRQTGMARSTRLVILIKNIYTLLGWKRLLLPVTYFPTNLVYPFTLWVTGIIIIICRFNTKN